MAATCPAVRFTEPAVPFTIGVPVRCAKDEGHAPNVRGDVWHSGGATDLDGEPFGTAWRHQLQLPGTGEL